MPTNYPTSLDTYGDPAGGQVQGLTTPTHAGHHTNHNDAIEAIEAVLGVGAAGSTPQNNLVRRGTGIGTATWGQVQTNDIATGQITSALIADGTIATIDLAANAVTQRPGPATGTTNPTITTPAGVVAFADPTITITTTAGSSVDIVAAATISCPVATTINLWYRVDGGAFIFLGETNLAAGGRSQVFGFDRVSGLSAASHLFEIGWFTTVGTATSVGVNRKMQLTELKK